MILGLIISCISLSAALSGNTYHTEWLAWLYHLDEQFAKNIDDEHVQPLRIWSKHKELLDKKKIKIGTQDVKFPYLFLGVKDYLIEEAVVYAKRGTWNKVSSRIRAGGSFDKGGDGAAYPPDGSAKNV